MLFILLIFACDVFAMQWLNTTLNDIPASNQTLYPALYAKHSNSTPLFHNISETNVNPLVKALAGHSNTSTSLPKRQSSTLR